MSTISKIDKPAGPQPNFVLINYVSPTAVVAVTAAAPTLTLSAMLLARLRQRAHKAMQFTTFFIAVLSLFTLQLAMLISNPSVHVVHFLGVSGEPAAYFPLAAVTLLALAFFLLLRVNKLWATLSAWAIFVAFAKIPWTVARNWILVQDSLIDTFIVQIERRFSPKELHTYMWEHPRACEILTPRLWEIALKAKSLQGARKSFAAELAKIDAAEAAAKAHQLESIASAITSQGWLEYTGQVLTCPTARKVYLIVGTAVFVWFVTGIVRANLGGSHGNFPGWTSKGDACNSGPSSVEEPPEVPPVRSVPKPAAATEPLTRTQEFLGGLFDIAEVTYRVFRYHNGNLTQKLEQLNIELLHLGELYEAHNRRVRTLEALAEEARKAANSQAGPTDVDQMD